jgi:hypothetical protein
LEYNGVTLQISKYIHGVGDSRNPIGRIIGGAFAAGVISPNCPWLYVYFPQL